MDNFSDKPTQLDSPARKHYAITPSDTEDETISFRSIYVGTGGNLTIVTEDGQAEEYKNAPSGFIIPVCGKRVNLTNLSATDLVGLY